MCAKLSAGSRCKNGDVHHSHRLLRPLTTINFIIINQFSSSKIPHFQPQFWQIAAEKRKLRTFLKGSINLPNYNLY